LDNSLKTKTIKGVFWSSVERFSVQGIQFVLSIIMARLLTPSDYGVIGMLAIILAISQTFIDSGFSNALIRKLDRTEVDFSTVFYFNIVIGIFCYFLLFFAAPFIARFFETPILTSVTKVIALNLLFNSLAVIPRAKLTVNVDFKNQAKASLVAVLVSGVIGLVFAYKGFGVWALVFQSVSNTGFSMILLWLVIKWKPRKSFSLQSFKEMFSYGSKLLLSGIISTLYENVSTIVIGKKFRAEDLGYYTRADQFGQFPSSNLTGIFQRVTFPILSSIQNDDERLKSVYRRYLRMSAFFIFPLMCGLAALAGPAIHLLLTEKWLGIVPLLQFLSISYMLYPVHAINLNLLQVKGRSDLFLKLEIYKKIIGVCILCVTIPLGIKVMCIGRIVSSFFSLILNTHYTGKIISFSFYKQIKELFPLFFSSASMGLIVFYISSLFANDYIKIVLGILVGVVWYVLINLVLKTEELHLIFSYFRIRGKNEQ
jgi:O-antigen/teichoic acid export membrane protein